MYTLLILALEIVPEPFQANLVVVPPEAYKRVLAANVSGVKNISTDFTELEVARSNPAPFLALIPFI